MCAPRRRCTQPRRHFLFVHFSLFDCPNGAINLFASLLMYLRKLNATNGRFHVKESNWIMSKFIYDFVYRTFVTLYQDSPKSIAKRSTCDIIDVDLLSIIAKQPNFYWIQFGMFAVKMPQTERINSIWDTVPIKMYIGMSSLTPQHIWRTHFVLMENPIWSVWN